jgi:aryl-alcohol dehydrogenase-like predicted oxidoreductase
MSIKCIRRACDLGINLVDTSLNYGQGQSELYLGKALAEHPNSMMIATKFQARRQEGETLRQAITLQCDESLRKLRRDHIDLYQGGQGDFPIEDVLEAVQSLVQVGKVRYAGSMNFGSWRHARANETAKAAGLPELVSTQHNYNLVRRHVELEVLPMCAAYNVGFLPNATLAGGYLTDNDSKGAPAPEGTRGAAGSPMVTRTRTAVHEDQHESLKTWAHDHGHTLGELALAWLAARPEVSSILTGVSTPEQVEANVRAGDWRLTDEDMAQLDKIASWDGSFERIEGSIRSPGEA